jgi:carbon starvation protein
VRTAHPLKNEEQQETREEGLMSAIVVAAIGLGAFALGYIVYSRFIATKIYRLDPDFVTPAHAMEDGVDYVPTNKFVL